jgi:Flp pilus assembly protein TadG
MNHRSIVHRFKNRIRQFIGSESGMTLPLLGIGLVMLISMVGMATDIGRLQLVQAKLQSATDAAGLAGGATSLANQSSYINNYLQANFNGYLGATLGDVNINAPNPTSFTITTSASVPTTFMSVLHVSSMTANAFTQINRAMNGIELVFVLDNSLSMNQTVLGGAEPKINALRTAAESLLSSIAVNSGNGANLWAGIVPFSQAVNIGTGHPTWLNTTYDATLGSTTPGSGPNVGTPNGNSPTVGWGSSGVVNANGASFSTSTWFGCVDARLAMSSTYPGLPEDETDDPPVLTNTNTLFNAYYWPTDNLNVVGPYASPTYTNSGINVWATPLKASGAAPTAPNDNNTYKYSYTSSTANFAKGLNTVGPNYMCPQPILPMTAITPANVSGIFTTTLNNLVVTGNTLLNQGLEWGWNLLSPRWQGYWGGAMNQNGLPLAYNTTGMIKAVVLVTDGQNYMSNYAHTAYWYVGDDKLGTRNQTTAKTILDTKTSELCTELKNNNVYVYTIGLGQQTDTTLLSECATPASGGNVYYYNSPTTTNLTQIFNNIGSSLTSLRVSH